MNNKPRVIVKLPCCQTNMEILKPGDQYVACPTCFRTYFLKWSKITGRSKLEGKP